MSEPNAQPIPARRSQRADTSPPPAADLSPAQARIWALDRLEPGSPLWNVVRAQRLQGGLDADALAGALADLVARAPLLRSRIVAAGGRPALVVDAVGTVRLERIDLGEVPAEVRLAAAERHAGWDVRRPFDLAGGPLARWTLLRLAEADHILLLCAHGIVVDGDGAAALGDRLVRRYRTRAGRSMTPLAARPLPDWPRAPSRRPAPQA